MNNSSVKGYKESQSVGSTYILGTGKDNDVLILVENAVATRQQFIDAGWECESNTKPEYDGAPFYSLRLGKDNALITSDESYYRRFLAAAEVCKFLFKEDPSPSSVIRARDTRVMIHKIVRDGYQLPPAGL